MAAKLLDPVNKSLLNNDKSYLTAFYKLSFWQYYYISKYGLFNKCLIYFHKFLS